MDEKTISFKRRFSDTSVVDYAAELFRTRAAADISIICDSMHFRCHKVMLLRRGQIQLDVRVGLTKALGGKLTEICSLKFIVK